MYLTVIPPGEMFGVGDDAVEVKGEAAEMQVTVEVDRWVAPDIYGSITVSLYDPIPNVDLAATQVYVDPGLI